MSPRPRCAQYLPSVLYHRGSELPRHGRGSTGGGPEEDGLVHSLENGPLDIPVLHADQHLLERHAVHQNQPQYQGGIPGRKHRGARVAVRTC